MIKFEKTKTTESLFAHYPKFSEYQIKVNEQIIWLLITSTPPTNNRILSIDYIALNLGQWKKGYGKQIITKLVKENPQTQIEIYHPLTEKIDFWFNIVKYLLQENLITKVSFAPQIYLELEKIDCSSVKEVNDYKRKTKLQIINFENKAKETFNIKWAVELNFTFEEIILHK